MKNFSKNLLFKNALINYLGQLEEINSFENSGRNVLIKCISVAEKCIIFV
jgi:hypothetical protein